MGAFFGFIFGLWLVVAMVISPYFWAKRTDKSQAPIVRRFTALAYGLTWPYLAVMYFVNKQQRANEARERDAAASRILGNQTGPATVTVPQQAGPVQTAPKVSSSIKNPFDA